ncbi:MAG: TRAP transporter TatT component family protein, partial [Deltaproteobacteria bacterium]
RPMKLAPLALLALPALVGCDFRAFTADSTADMLHAASPQFNTLEDLAFAEVAAPANLVTMEAVWRVSQHNQDVLVELAQGWTSLGFGFYEDHLERAALADNESDTEHWRMRTKAAYLRGRLFGFSLMNERHHADGGPQAVYARGLEPWRQYLLQFTTAADAPALYWAGNAWLSWIQQSLDDPGALLDVPFAVALMERVRTLDEHYNHDGVHGFFGLYYASTPRDLGGRPDDSRREFETALRATGRRFLMYQVWYARTYAVMVQDRALYRRLLEEVIHAGDVFPEERLTNQVAKRRAMRYLTQIDTLFGAPEEPASAPAPSAAGEVTP